MKPSIRHGLCDCADRGCPIHEDQEFCGASGKSVVYRIDMEDETGTLMCDPCAEDALESGVFCTAEDIKDEFENERPI